MKEKVGSERMRLRIDIQKVLRLKNRVEFVSWALERGKMEHIELKIALTARLIILLYKEQFNMHSSDAEREFTNLNDEIDIIPPLELECDISSMVDDLTGEGSDVTNPLLDQPISLTDLHQCIEDAIVRDMKDVPRIAKNKIESSMSTLLKDKTKLADFVPKPSNDNVYFFTKTSDLFVYCVRYLLDSKLASKTDIFGTTSKQP